LHSLSKASKAGRTRTVQKAAVFEEIITSEDTEKLKIEVTDKGETLEERILYSTLQITDIFGETRL
jgi:hypothetical protein